MKIIISINIYKLIFILNKNIVRIISIRIIIESTGIFSLSVIILISIETLSLLKSLQKLSYSIISEEINIASIKSSKLVNIVFL